MAQSDTSKDTQADPKEIADRCRYVAYDNADVLRCEHPAHSGCRDIILNVLGEEHKQWVLKTLEQRGQLQA